MKRPRLPHSPTPAGPCHCEVCGLDTVGREHPADDASRRGEPGDGALLLRVRDFADGEAPVVILGESGTGKVEREHVRRVPELCGGNQVEAARVLQVSRSTLCRKLRAGEVWRPDEAGRTARAHPAVLVGEAARRAHRQIASDRPVSAGPAARNVHGTPAWMPRRTSARGPVLARP